MSDKRVQVEIDEYGEIVNKARESESFGASPLPIPRRSPLDNHRNESGFNRFLAPTVGLFVIGIIASVLGILFFTQGSLPNQPSEVSSLTATVESAPSPTLDTSTTQLEHEISDPPMVTPTALPTSIATKSTSTPLPNVIEPDVVFIPDGEFTRGSSREDIRDFVKLLCSDYPDSWCREDAFKDELKHSDVSEPDTEINYISSYKGETNAFYIDRHEVTNAEYARCVESRVCNAPQYYGSNNPRRLYYENTQYADYPVIYVTWRDAQTYCHWAGGRLPTAMEWEKAARGTDGRMWPWGNEKPITQANFRRPGQEAANEDKDGSNLRGGDVMPIMSYSKDVSPYGVWDMAGNVMEWVGTKYSRDRYEIRGGSWNTGSFTTRAASRVAESPNKDAYFDVGFRCAYDDVP
jgi:formylglycine-generating enzyme required for sulfatase activity